MSSIAGVTGLELQGTRTANSMSSLLGKVTLLASRYKNLFSLCDQGVVSITNFATGVVIGRVCGKAELGVYTLAWTIMTLATELSGMLTTTPYTVFSPQLDREERRDYLGSILVHQLLLAGFFAMLLGVGALLGSWRGWLPRGGLGVAAITAAVTVSFCMREFVRRISFAELKIGWALLVDVGACFGQIVGVLLLLHYGALTSSRGLILLGITSGGAAAAWLFVQRRSFRPNTKMYAADLKRNWRLSKWVLASGVLYAFVRYLFPWVLAASHGISVTGTWAACTAIVALGNPVLMGLGNHLLPELSNIYAASGVRAMQRHAQRSCLVYIGLLTPIVLVLVCFGDLIVTRIYGMTYAGNGGIITLLALNMLVTALVNPYSLGLFTLDRAKSDTLVNLVWVILLFTGGIAAVKLYAAFGAAAALLICGVITAAIRLGVFNRQARLAA